MSIFEKTDFDELKAAQVSEQKARDEAEQKNAEDEAVIREALGFALSCYADALRELPEYEKEGELGYVKFNTGFSHPEKRRLVDQQKSTVLKKKYEFTGGTAYYLADTDGVIEKHWRADGADTGAEDVVRESSVEEFRDVFLNLIKDAEIKAARGDYAAQLPEGFSLLGKLAFKEHQALEDGFSNFYFRSGIGSQDTLADSLKNKGEVTIAVKELLLWCLGGEPADKWLEK